MNVFLSALRVHNRLLVVGLSLAAAGLGAFGSSTVAQASAVLLQGETPVMAQAAEPKVEQVIYVDSSAGNDDAAGTFGAPVRTITRAIAAARPGMVIQLAPGTYSADTGEQFPLVIPQGVTVRGSERSRGQGIDVVGGGRFLSRTQAGQSVAIVLGDGASVKGVTVANPTVRGTGIWVESGTATIMACTLSGSHREGVFLSGSANVTVQGNVFYRNGGNGIAITRESQGLIAGNVFEETGYGIAIGDFSRPTLRQNRVVNNRDGIVINGSARPVLRGNTIENNQNDGVVVIGQAIPDLGTPSSPGGNQIRGNGRNAVFNATRDQIPFPFYGNTVSGPAPVQTASVPTPAPSQAVPTGETVPVIEAEEDGGWAEGTIFDPATER